MEFFTICLLNGLSYGLLLFMLSSGLTLIFSMLGVLNFAHASFYMLGAYFAYTCSRFWGYWPALFLAPVAVALLAALFERFCLRRVRSHGHVSELLITWGLGDILLEGVQLFWGRSAVDYRIPPELDGPLFTVYGSQFSMYRAWMMAVALWMLLVMWLVLKKTRIGLVIEAALSHPQTVETLGHNVQRVFTLVFAGGAGLAGLAGVMGGNAFVTEPGMAVTVGSIIFVVVVVGGLGSLAGAWWASLLIGVVQSFAVALDVSLLSLAHTLGALGFAMTPDGLLGWVFKLKLSQLAPVWPYLLLVLILIGRPKGLLGKRER